MMRQLGTLPNLLTMLRMVLVPVFMWMFFLGGAWLWGASIIFTIAALTDYGDGFFARRMGIVSGLGILLDPIADKVLVTSVFACFAYISMLPWWFLALLLGRDLLITGIRWFWSGEASAMGPSYLGKCKTVAQIILIYVLFACLMGEVWLMQGGWYNHMIIVVKVLMYFVAGITAYTGLDYVRRYWMLKRSGPSSKGVSQQVPAQATPVKVTPAHVVPDQKVTKKQKSSVADQLAQGQNKPVRRVRMAKRQVENDIQ